MKKIKSLFKRDYEGTRKVYDEVVPGSEWVQRGEGQATRKWDGTSCLIKGGIIYKRYDVKKGRDIPKDGIPCEPKPDDNTGHWPWWIPVLENKNEDKYHIEAYNDLLAKDEIEDGTYELCGPKINGNKEHFDSHILLKHGDVHFECPTSFLELKLWLENNPMEGIVWHHPDGRMVKIKSRDFGLNW